MAAILQLLGSNPAARAQALLAQFTAGAQGAAKSGWTEIMRPLTALALTPVQNSQTGVSGGAAGAPPALALITIGPISLPIGMDIKSITCTARDVDNGWLCTNFTFGTLNLVNPQGSASGVNLSMFDPRLQHVDRLAPWILSKTKVDVQVTAVMFNACFNYDTATPPVGAYTNAAFHGFSLNAFQEEQVCAIQTRIEPTDRNVGVADLIDTQRRTIGMGLNLQLPSFMQPPSQTGRVPIAQAPHIGPARQAVPAMQQVGRQAFPGYDIG
jgi:hypothetical protein